MSTGSASNSGCGRTSINVGHFGVPMRRTSFSIEIVFGAGMARPLLLQGAERDALACASWGDRNPHARIENPHFPHVKTRRRPIAWLAPLLPNGGRKRTRDRHGEERVDSIDYSVGQIAQRRTHLLA